MPQKTGRLHHIEGTALSAGTAQTPGMSRFAAISGAATGAQAIWMGRTHVAPNAASGPHHHGASEAGIYVVSGHPTFIYREGDREVRLRTAPGDYVYVPPFVPHIEANDSPDEEAVVVIAQHAGSHRGESGQPVSSRGLASSVPAPARRPTAAV